jgi:hypothetical protein
LSLPQVAGCPETVPHFSQQQKLEGSEQAELLQQLGYFIWPLPFCLVAEIAVEQQEQRNAGA